MSRPSSRKLPMCIGWPVEKEGDEVYTERAKQAKPERLGLWQFGFQSIDGAGRDGCILSIKR